MKILLDENLPKKIKASFGNNFDVFTVGEMGWNGKKNGELLGLMTINGFNTFVTIDKNLKHQQNIERFPLQLFILNAPNNTLKTLEPFIAKLKNVLVEKAKDSIVEISI